MEKCGDILIIFKLILVLELLTSQLCIAYTGAKMGVKNEKCDDGFAHLERDWDGNFQAYTCAKDEKLDDDVQSGPKYYSIPGLDPLNDEVHHHCMDEEIKYNITPPLRGPHRPLWAIYGEYLYLPPQRWLHNLEHGSIVLLYHPCVPLEIVNAARAILTSCIYRYVITPSRLVSNKLPINFISWGSKLELPINFKSNIAAAFIKKHARYAPEDLSKQGQFDRYLLKQSQEVAGSDIDDSNICPWLNEDNYKQAEMNLNQYNTDPDSDEVVHRRERRFIYKEPQSFYDRIYLNELQKFNGPKYAQDVLPPTAMKLRFASPNYVMAGTFLGTDPFNPRTLPKKMPANPTNLQFRQGKLQNTNTQRNPQQSVNSQQMSSSNDAINQHMKLQLIQILLNRLKQQQSNGKI